MSRLYRQDTVGLTLRLVLVGLISVLHMRQILHNCGLCASDSCHIR